jgi:predicted Zn-dependent protease
MQAPGQDKAPLASLQEWLALQPGDDTVRLALAEGLLSLGDLPAALAEYETLKETQSRNPVVWNNLAWLYQQAGDRRAVDHGERALALAPNQPAIMDTLAWILVDEGEAARAATLLRQAHLAAPDSADIAFHYAVALHRNGDDAAAAAVLKSLLESEKAFPARAEAAELLGKLVP